MSTHITLTVDGLTLLDARLSPQQQKPNRDLQEVIKPTHPQPWTLPVAMIITPAILNNTETHIEIKTGAKDWWMKVTTQ